MGETRKPADNMELTYLLTNNDMVNEVSNSFASMTGYSRDEIMGMHINDVLGLLRAAKINSFKGSRRIGEYFIFTRDNNALNVFISTPKPSQLNKQAYYFEELLNSRIENKFSLLEQFSRDNVVGIAILSVPDFIFLKANEKLLSSLDPPGNNLNNVIGRTIGEIVTGWSEDETKFIMENIIKINKTYYGEELPYNKMKRGLTYWNIVAAPISENGTIKYLACNIVEVTDKVSSRMLSDSQSKLIQHHRDLLYQILNTLDFPIARVSYPDLKIIELNKKSYQYIQQIGLDDKSITEDNMIGKIFTKVFHQADLTKSLKIISEIAVRKTASYINDYEITFGENKSYVNVVFHPIFDSSNEVSELFIIVVDVTREIIQKKDLEQVLKMQEEFFSYISHEFKTPLTVINSAVQVLKLLYTNDIPPKVMSYINKINQSTLQQIRLVNNLLDITKAATGYLKIHKENLNIVSLTRTIVDSVSLYAMKKNITVHFSSQLSEKTIAMDGEKYERIIMNLLSNSIKFTPYGKSIYVNLDAVNDKILIEVRDEGIGIPKEMHKTIFERFTQLDNSLIRQSEGTGLGLCLVKTLVDAMEGEIILESEQDKGSSFKISLPDSNALEESSQKSASPMDNQLVQMLNVEFSNVYYDYDL